MNKRTQQQAPRRAMKKLGLDALRHISGGATTTTVETHFKVEIKGIRDTSSPTRITG